MLGKPGGVKQNGRNSPCRNGGSESFLQRSLQRLWELVACWRSPFFSIKLAICGHVFASEELLADNCQNLRI
jgi:hypothetical protein